MGVVMVAGTAITIGAVYDVDLGTGEERAGSGARLVRHRRRAGVRRLRPGGRRGLAARSPRTPAGPATARACPATTAASCTRRGSTPTWAWSTPPARCSGSAPRSCRRPTSRFRSVLIKRQGFAAADADTAVRPLRAIRGRCVRGAFVEKGIVPSPMAETAPDAACPDEVADPIQGAPSGGGCSCSRRWSPRLALWRASRLGDGAAAKGRPRRRPVVAVVGAEPSDGGDRRCRLRLDRPIVVAAASPPVDGHGSGSAAWRAVAGVAAAAGALLLGIARLDRAPVVGHRCRRSPSSMRRGRGGLWTGLSAPLRLRRAAIGARHPARVPRTRSRPLSSSSPLTPARRSRTRRWAGQRHGPRAVRSTVSAG